MQIKKPTPQQIARGKRDAEEFGEVKYIKTHCATCKVQIPMERWTTGKGGAECEECESNF